MTTMTAGEARGKYRKGTAFERKIRDQLHAFGYAVARGAGSKGTSKADLVAFSPHGAILIIQAKTNGIISAAEWDRLYEIALWSAQAYPNFTVCRVIPVIAYKDARGKTLMDEITGFRVHRKPRENRRPYDWRCACSPPHDDLSKIDKA
jgi:hypothetical protein